MPDTSSTVSIPCTAAMVSTARHATRSLLATTPVVEEAELIVSEFVTNSVRWSESGSDGRPVELTVSRDEEGNSVRLEVVDAGRRKSPAPVDQEAADEHGHGLQLVNALAKDWGHRTKPNRSTYWAVLTW